MEYGTIVKLNENIEQGFTTFTKGMEMAVAHYSHKYFVKLNTFGEEKNISELLAVKYEDISQKLTVVGHKKFVESDEVSKFKVELQIAVNERNQAWFKLEELEEKSQ